MSNERWTSVPGWEGFYEVSSLGRIRSKPREGKTQFGARLYGGSVLKPIPSKTNGYLVVNLTGHGRRKQRLVHRVVMEAFCGQPPAGMECCHNNGDRHDCRLENLRWDTRRNNHADKVAHGTHQIGSRNPRAALTEEKAAYAKASRAPLKELAAELGVSVGCVSKIRYGQTWRHA